VSLGSPTPLPHFASDYNLDYFASVPIFLDHEPEKIVHVRDVSDLSRQNSLNGYWTLVLQCTSQANDPT